MQMAVQSPQLAQLTLRLDLGPRRGDVYVPGLPRFSVQPSLSGVLLVPAQGAHAPREAAPSRVLDS